MVEKINLALERFPDLALAIKQYAADNRFFHDLCADYGEAVDVLRRWEAADSTADPVNTGHLQFCRELVEDLEREILFELEHWNGR